MKRAKNYEGAVKLFLLLIGTPLLVYWAGIRRTVSLWKAGRETGMLIEAARTDTVGSGIVSERLPLVRDGENLLKSGGLLGVVTPLAERYGVSPEKYTPCLIRETEDAEIYAGELTLTGGYLPLTRMLAALEKLPGSVRIVSVEYRLGVRPRTRENVLQLTLVSQQITIHSNDRL